jgi:hypothetical protein
VAVAVFALAWFCVDGLLIPPDFGHTDIYYFKDAGINFAAGLGLTTRFTYGSPGFAYHDYAVYPPLYAFAFGVFASLFGISAVANQAFNSLIAIAVGLIGFSALRPIILSGMPGRKGARIAWAVCAASIATGFNMPVYDRPDGMAVALGAAALLLAIRGRSRRSALGAGILCGLTLFTSPFAGIWTGLAVILGLMAAAPASARGMWLRRLLYVAIGGASTTLLILGVLRLTLPGWFGGFFGVASGSQTHNETGGGYFLALLHGDVRTWLGGFPYSTLGSCVPLMRLASVAAALGAVILAGRIKHREGQRAWRLLPLLIVSSLCLLTSPYQSHYPMITAALLLAAWAAVEISSPTNASRYAAGAILMAFVFNIALTAPVEAQRMGIRVAAHPSMSRALAFLSARRNRLEMPGRYTAVSPTVYILWRQAGLHPLINIYSGLNVAEDRAKIDFYALSYPGSGNPLTPQRVDSMSNTEYAPVFRPELPQLATILGFPLSNSSQSWESAIYGRRACELCRSLQDGATAFPPP